MLSDLTLRLFLETAAWLVMVVAAWELLVWGRSWLRRRRGSK